MRRSACLLAMFLAFVGSVSFAGSENILYGFNTYAKGQFPAGELIRDSAGNLYGVTSNGGNFGNGTVFELSPKAEGGWSETLLYSFRGSINGAHDGYNPTGKLVFDHAGNLYGATTWGGSVDVVRAAGTVFKLTRNFGGEWSEKILWSFQNTKQGFNPQGGMVFDSADNLYGTTRFGGGFSNQECSFDGGCGTVFRLSPSSDGTYSQSVLYVFQDSGDGANPNDALTIDAKGNLYGTTAGVNNDTNGSVFELRPSSAIPWNLKTIYSFVRGTTGYGPSGGVIFDNAGNLYGTTVLGGNSTGCAGQACGTVYKLSEEGGGFWSQSVIYSFNGQDGDLPEGEIAFDSSGNLYGTTEAGGANSLGVVYELTPASGGNWNEDVLWSFVGKNDGSNPHFGVLPGNGTQVWGVTGDMLRPVAGYGAVFQLTRNPAGNWTESTIESFPQTDGGLPTSGLVADASGTLYGATSTGGLYGFGTVFALIKTVSGQWRQDTLFDFPEGIIVGTNNSAGAGTPVMDAVGNLFVAARYGGTKRLGSVYAFWHTFDHSYVIAKIFEFSGRADGANPVGNLLLDQAGNLYGTTIVGGTGAACGRGCGTVYKLDFSSQGAWPETVLYSFKNGSDGSNPMAGLVSDHSGNLYGTTQFGGFHGSICGNGCGTVFQLMPSSTGYTEQVLYAFTNESRDGADPLSNLTIDATGNLFGTTNAGGLHNGDCGYSGCGTVFELTSSAGGWSKTNIFAFNRSDGFGPAYPVTLDTARNIYGVASGGPSFSGIVFELSPSSGGQWQSATLYSFGAFGQGDCYFPDSGFVLDNAGNLYGTAEGGGRANNGCVYEITP